MAIDYLPARNASTGTEGRQLTTQLGIPLLILKCKHSKMRNSMGPYIHTVDEHTVLINISITKTNQAKPIIELNESTIFNWKLINCFVEFYLTDLISPKDVTSQWVYELKKLLIDPKTLHSVNYTSHFPVLMEAFRPCCCRSTLRFNFNKPYT
uniref:Uncharacterized protein n=1 Tax=Glossina austeni TaxID=7395 RepID=A0A1A9V5A6_GLOAU